MEEQRHPLGAKVAVAILGPVGGVDLGIGVQVTHALDVDDDELVAGAFEREVAEGVRGLPGHPVLDEARVAVVLDVFAVDVVLDVKQGLAGTIDQLQDGHHEDVHLLGRVVPVELLAPQFGIHLELDVLEVGLALDILVHVSLGHVVVAVPAPVLVVTEVAQLLHPVAFPHSTRGEGLLLHLDHHLLGRPGLVQGVVSAPDGLLYGQLAQVELFPRVLPLLAEDDGLEPVPGGLRLWPQRDRQRLPLLLLPLERHRHREHGRLRIALLVQTLDAFQAKNR